MDTPRHSKDFNWSGGSEIYFFVPFEMRRTEKYAEDDPCATWILLFTAVMRSQRRPQ